MRSAIDSYKPVGQSPVERMLNGSVIAEHWTRGGHPPASGDGSGNFAAGSMVLDQHRRKATP